MFCARRWAVEREVGRINQRMMRQGFEGGAGQCAEELWDGGGGCEGEDVKGTDWHFDILQDVSIYN